MPTTLRLFYVTLIFLLFGSLVEASQSRGEINKSSDQYLETQINANNTTTLTSAQDTQLEGAQVNANRIVANVGGDLNIISQQDEERYRNRQESIGGRIGVGIGASSPINASINASELKADSEYIAVQEQSGLFAGEGGFDVNVGQNTNLQGGAIVSEADPESNRLSTEILSASNLENSAKYNVESKTISFSTSGVGSATQGFGGGFSEDKGESSNTTFSAISEGTVDIRSNPNQSLDNIKRSKEQAHQVLERIFSEDKIDQARETAEVTQLFAEEAFLVVGDAYKRIDELEAVLESDSLSTEERNTLELRLNRLKAIWPDDKATAHALVGGLTSVLGGGNFAQGALAAGLNESLSETLEQQLGSDATLNNLAKTVIGGLASGTQGAIIAANADQFNRQLHPDELKLIDQHAEAYAREQGIEDIAEARRILTQVALYNNDSLWQQIDEFGATHEQYGQTAGLFLQTLAQNTGNTRLFTSTQSEFNNNTLNSQYLGQYNDLYNEAFAPLTGVSGRTLNVSPVGLALTATLDKGQINTLTANEQQTVLTELNLFIKEVSAKAAIAEAKVTNTNLSAEERQTALREHGQLSSLETRLNSSYLQLVTTADGIDGSRESRLAYVEALSILSATGANLSRGDVVGSDTGRRVLDGQAQRDSGPDTQQPIIDPNRLLDNPARNRKTGELDPNYRAPEDPNAPIESFPAPEGTRVQMAIDESFQIDPVTGQTVNPGGFTTRDNIISEKQVRDDLAVKEEFKEDITHVQEFEIKPGTQVQESTVGPQINPDGSVLEGGGNQIQILRQPGQRNSDVLIPIGNPRPVE